MKNNLYFWNHSYRHYLRGVTTSKQNRVLRGFVDNDLPIDGESDKHLNIINSIIIEN